MSLFFTGLGGLTAGVTGDADALLAGLVVGAVLGTLEALGVKL